VIGVSALLTTTMTGMREVVALVHARGLADRVKVIVGGAPVTEAFAPRDRGRRLRVRRSQRGRSREAAHGRGVSGAGLARAAAARGDRRRRRCVGHDADRRGRASARRPPERVLLEAPEIVGAIARRYLDAGAEILTTDTFGGTPLRLAAHGLAERCEEINRRAVELAREAAGRARARLGLGRTDRDAPRPLGPAPPPRSRRPSSASSPRWPPRASTCSASRR